MSKEEVLMFGLILEASDFIGEIGVTEEDLKLYRAATFKSYGLTEESSEEDFKLAEKTQEKDLKSLVESFRDKLKRFTK